MKKVIMCIAVLASFIGLGLGCWRMETKNTVDITKFDEKEPAWCSAGSAGAIHGFRCKKRTLSYQRNL